LTTKFALDTVPAELANGSTGESYMPIVRDDLGTYFHIPAKDLMKYKPLDPTEAEKLIKENKDRTEASGYDVELQEMRPPRFATGPSTPSWYSGD
jgi:hypothetical protein